VVGKWIGVHIGVNIGGVRYIETLRLSPVDELILIKEIVTSTIAIAWVEGTFKRYLHGMWIGVDTSIREVIIQAGAAPSIVGLIRRHAGLEQQVLVAPVITNDEEDKARIACGGGQFGQIDASYPVGWDIKRGGHCPVTHDHASHGVRCWNGLVNARKDAEGG
jgi:hypothetical protein